jgi:hypothetical protein
VAVEDSRQTKLEKSDYNRACILGGADRINNFELIDKNPEF